MIKKLAVVLCCFVAVNACAQVTKVNDVKKMLSAENKDTVAWVHGGSLTIGINEGFLHNWAAGGELASLTVNGIFNGYLTYYNHGAIWSNNMDVKYGLSYVYSNDFVPRKTDDVVDFTSKYSSLINGHKDLFYTALFNFKSQFTQGFDYSVPNWQSSPTSGPFAPAYFTLAAGLEYRKGSKISIFLSPVAARATYADAQYTKLSPQGAFGIPYGKTSKYDLGAYFTGRYMVDFNKLISFSTRVDLYSNYLAKDTKDSAGNVIKKDNPGNIQVLWDNLLTWKATKYLGLTIGVTIVYSNDNPYSSTYIDKTTGAVMNKNQPAEGLGWVQLNQSFTFGLVYKF